MFKDKESLNNGLNNSKNILNYQNLLKLRIIQKKLIYIIGLSPEIADEKVLCQKEYFGQYGVILKLMVNKNNAFNQNGIQGYSYSAYVTYQTELEAIIAIQSVDNFIFKERTIKASYGTTKYCQYFLKNIECTNLQCLYVHELQDKSLIYNENINNKEIFKLQQKQVQLQLKEYYDQIIKFQVSKTESIFPNAYKLINKLQKQKQKNNINQANKNISQPSQTVKIDILNENSQQDNNENYQQSNNDNNNEIDNVSQNYNQIIIKSLNQEPNNSNNNINAKNNIQNQTEVNVNISNDNNNNNITINYNNNYNNENDKENIENTTVFSECLYNFQYDDIIENVVSEQGEIIYKNEIDKKIIISCKKNRQKKQNSRFNFANNNQDYSYFQGPNFRDLLNNIYKN